jgi:hypothetical protein
MKYFITHKKEFPIHKRVIRKFLWLPEIREYVNDTAEYRWLEWKYIEQYRYSMEWTDFNNKIVDKKEYMYFKKNKKA